MTRESLDFDEKKRMTLGFAVAKLRFSRLRAVFFWTTLYIGKSLSHSTVLTPGHSSTHSAVIRMHAPPHKLTPCFLEASL